MSVLDSGTRKQLLSTTSKFDHLSFLVFKETIDKNQRALLFSFHQFESTACNGFVIAFKDKLNAIFALMKFCSSFITFGLYKLPENDSLQRKIENCLGLFPLELGIWAWSKQAQSDSAMFSGILSPSRNFDGL